MQRLRTNQLYLERDGHIVCQALDLSVQTGELLIVGGANGAGKTSLLRALAGLVEVDNGMIDSNSGSNHSDETSDSEVLYIGHQHGLRSELTVYENLCFSAGLRDPAHHLGYIEVSEALAYFDMTIFIDALCGKLSEGQRQRTALTRLLTEPTGLWILDEPSASLDAAGLQALNKLLGAHLAQGKAAVVATHRQIVPDQGKITYLTLPC